MVDYADKCVFVIDTSMVVIAIAINMTVKVLENIIKFMMGSVVSDEGAGIMARIWMSVSFVRVVVYWFIGW
jgi:hypothetical protein